VAARLAGPVDYRHPPPDHYRRTGPEERPDVEEPDRPADPPRPPKVGYETQPKSLPDPTKKHLRWMRAQGRGSAVV